MQILTPQQQAFLANYLDPQSETWSNAYQSAIKAGYAKEYAETITSLMPKWLSEALSDTSLVQEAQTNLGEFLRDTENKNLKWDATKFVLTRLAKHKYSERQELTGANGKDLFNDYAELTDEELRRIADAGEGGVSEAGTGETQPA